MWVGSTSSGPTAAAGLPPRNGSISTRVSPSVSSKQAWPRKRMSIGCPPESFVVEFARQLPPHGHADEHADPSLLGEERADGADALVGVRGGRGLEHLALVR